jgi:hypothetical protein
MNYFNKSKHKLMYRIIEMMFGGIFIYAGAIFLFYDGSFSEWKSFIFALLIILIGFVIIYFILYYLSQTFKFFKSFSNPKNQEYPEFVFKKDINSTSKTTILLILVCFLMIISSFFIYYDYKIIIINFVFFASIITWTVLVAKKKGELKNIKDIILKYLKF